MARETRSTADIVNAQRMVDLAAQAGFDITDSQMDLRGTLLDKLVQGVEGLTGDAKQAYDHLEYYAEYVMSWMNPEYVRPSEFISRCYRELQYTNNDMLAIGPRGSAKSTSITITYVSWAIGRNPLIRFLLAFAIKEKQGDPFLRQLKQIITNNQRYIEVFGELKDRQPEKWDDTEIIVRRPTPPGGLKDSTVYICGLGTAVPSKRADIVICDDLVYEDNAYSETLRERVVNFVLKTLFPILVPGGRKIILGTTWHPKDLYAYIAEAWRLRIPPPDPSLNLDELLEYYDEGLVEEREITFE